MAFEPRPGWLDGRDGVVVPWQLGKHFCEGPYGTIAANPPPPSRQLVGTRRPCKKAYRDSGNAVCLLDNGALCSSVLYVLYILYAPPAAPLLAPVLQDHYSPTDPYLAILTVGPRNGIS